MAYSEITHLGDGSNVSFTLNFPLGVLDRADVTCRVGTEVDGLGDPAYRTISWVTDSLVNISGDPPGVGVAVVFQRTVDKEALIHDYTNGAPIEESNLDDSNKQAIMLIHELLDGRFDAGLGTDLNLAGHRIINLEDGVDPQDAVTLSQMEAYTGNAPTYAAAAAASAVTAASQAAALKGTSTSNVSYGTGNKSFTTQSGKQFNQGNGIMVVNTSDTTKYMAGSVVSYVGTTLIVNVTKFNGTGSNNNWTINISGLPGEKGDTGAAGVGTGDMLASNNLSDLTDQAAARSNLGLGSAAQSNTTAFATAAQGALADTALQPGDVSSSLDIDHIVFTSSGTYTKPTNLLYAIVEVIGGGGGGGGADCVSTSYKAVGGSGGGGGYSRKLIAAASIGATETVTIGAGGSGGSATNGGNGSTGGTSSFGTHCTASGGGGGTGSGESSADPDFVSGTTGGIGAGGDLNLRGGSSGAGFYDAVGLSGNGGDSALAGGARGVVTTSSTAGIAASANTGGGGSGALAVNTSGSAGGSGGSGIIIITEYLSV